MRWLYVVLLTAGCSFTFDGAAPEIVLSGYPTDTTRLPRLNHAPVHSDYYVLGADSQWWLTLEERRGNQHIWHSVSLFPPGKEQEIVYNPDTDRSSVHAFYRVETIPGLGTPAYPGKTLLRLQTAGAAPEEAFEFPLGPAHLATGPWDNLFVYWVKDPKTKTFEIVRRDRSYRRTIPIPEGIDPEVPGLLLFSSNGQILFTRDKSGHLVKHYTDREVDIDLGIHKGQLMFDESRKVFYTFGHDGIHRTKLDGTGEIVLDPTPDPAYVSSYEDRFYYFIGRELRRVLPDGSEQPQVVSDGGITRLLGFAPDGQLMYSTVAANHYVHNSGDGWIGAWRFMERGRSPGFSVDRKRLRWLEHTAQHDGVGDLMQADLPRGDPVRLARNVYGWTEINDRRLLVVDNAAYFGTQNRIIAIDPDARTARWVANSAWHFSLLTATEMLVDLVTDTAGYDVVRMTIPPP